MVNAARDADSNRHARDFALSFGLPQTSGSDIHSTRQTRLCGIRCTRRLTGGGDGGRLAAASPPVPKANHEKEH